jgi:hypothetical protein
MYSTPAGSTFVAVLSNSFVEYGRLLAEHAREAVPGAPGSEKHTCNKHGIVSALLEAGTSEINTGSQSAAAKGEPALSFVLPLRRMQPKLGCPSRRVESPTPRKSLHHALFS